MDTRTTAFPALRRLAQAFAAEARLAQIDGEPARAADSLLNGVQLGINCSRGGVFIDSLVAIAIEQIAAGELEHFPSQMNAEQCRRIAIALESLDADRPEWMEITREERLFAHRAFPLRLRIVGLFTDSRKVSQSVEEKYTQRQTATRRLILAFASRAYELENGNRPASASDLVPHYLKLVPVDPISGTNLTLLP